MRKLLASRSATLVLFSLTATVNLHGQTGQPLSLVDTILMPNVKGRLDHLYVDFGSKRLFVSGLENGSVEVVDLKASKWLHTMPGFQKPPGILFVPRLDKILVASGDDGMVRIFTGKTLRLLDSIKLDRGAKIPYGPSRATRGEDSRTGGRRTARSFHGGRLRRETVFVHSHLAIIL
jgi:WD40 repeat protein